MGKVCGDNKFDIVVLSPEDAGRIPSDAFMPPVNALEVTWSTDHEMGDIYLKEERGYLKAPIPFRGLDRPLAFLEVNTLSIWRNSRFFAETACAARKPHSNSKYFLFSEKNALEISVLTSDPGPEKRSGSESNNIFFGGDDNLLSKTLPPNVKVVSATYGHFNRDGLTDLKLNLSNGGAIILRQREKPLRKCKEVPDIKPDPRKQDSKKPEKDFRGGPPIDFGE